MADFRWNDWNRDHVRKHGCTCDEAERVIESATAPYPSCRADDKWLVIGRGQGGRLVQVIYVHDPPGMVYVIHARPLTAAEKRRHRRRTR